MKVLLVVDLQSEFLNEDIENCLEYINEHGDSYDKIIATTFRRDDNVNYNFVQHMDHKALKFKKAKIDTLLCRKEDVISIVKNGYSFNENPHDLNELLAPTDIIDIIGCDLDACVMAICFTLWDQNREFRVLTDYCYTTAKSFTKDDVIKIMKRNFGDCIV